MPKWFKLLCGVLLLPVAWGMTRALVRVVGVSWRADAVWVALVAGAGCWLTVLWLLPKPTRLYVLEHEWTHALWAWLFGVRVKRIRARASGGQVTLSRSNFLIALAPYFFPLYAVLVMAAFGIGNLIWDWRPHMAWFHLLLGAAYAFHLTFTVETLSAGQSDLGGAGLLFLRRHHLAGQRAWPADRVVGADGASGGLDGAGLGHGGHREDDPGLGPCVLAAGVKRACRNGTVRAWFVHNVTGAPRSNRHGFMPAGPAGRRRLVSAFDRKPAADTMRREFRQSGRSLP